MCFSSIADFPLTSPFLKIAVVKWMYRQTPRNGYCPGHDQPRIKAMKDQDFVDVEETLRFFHNSTKSYLDSLSAFHRAQFLGNADSAVVDATHATPKTSTSVERQRVLKAHLKPLLHRLKTSWKEWDEKDLPEWCRIYDEPEQVSVAVAKGSKVETYLLPKVITYDADGNPTEKQEQLELQDHTSNAILEWRPFFCLEAVHDKMRREMAKAAVVAASTALMLQSLPLIAGLPLTLKRDGSKLRVICEKDMTPGSLQIPWYSQDLKYLVDKSEHPFAVEVKHSMIEADGKVNDFSFQANPQWSVPMKTTETSSSVEEFVWTEKNCVNWFWGFRRLPDEELWNCELTTFVVNIVNVARFNQVSALSDGTPLSVTAEVLLPMITNTRHINKDDEIVLKVARQPEKEKAKRFKNWVTDAAKAKKAR